MKSAELDLERFNHVDRYSALMDVIRKRVTNRQFVAGYNVPKNTLK